MASMIIIKLLLFITRVLVFGKDYSPGQIISIRYEYYDLLEEAENELKEIAG